MTSRYLERNARPWLPVMGEYHFVRDNRENWYRELCKMKAGGVDLVATYLFWIYHEEEEGKLDFFRRPRHPRLCAGRKARRAGGRLRLGRGHGECRNGGFPDWLLQKAFSAAAALTPEYMALVHHWYSCIYREVEGLFSSRTADRSWPCSWKMN